MRDNLEKIDDYFKDRLEHYEESPPYQTWDRIAERLGHNKKRRALFFITRIAAGLAFLISLSILIYNTQKTNKSDLAVRDKTNAATESIIDKDNTTSAEKERSTIRKSGLQQNEMGDKSGQTLTVPVETMKKGLTEQALHTERIADNAIQDYQQIIGNQASTARMETENPGYLVPLSFHQIKLTVAKPDDKIGDRDKPKPVTLPAMNPDQLLAYNDESGIQKSRQTEWTLGGQFAPLYSYRSLSSDFYQDYVKDQINSKESGVIAYAGGISIQMSPGSRFSVQSGIYYSKYGQDKSNLESAAYSYNGWSYYDATNDAMNQANPPVYIGNSTGQIVANQDFQDFYSSPSPYSRTELSEANAVNSAIPVKSITQYLEYLELPVNLKYKFFDRKLDISFTGGVSTSFLIGTDVYLNYSDNSRQNTDYVTKGLDRVNYSGSVGLGFEYPLSKSFNFNIEPRFRYYFNDVATDPNYNIHPYSIGIYTGISYEF